MGIDESVLQELQRVRYQNCYINLILTVIKSWESKVARSRVANFGFIRDEPFYDDEHSDMPPPSSNGVHANDNVDNNSHPILQYPHNQDYNQNATSAPSVASLANLAASNSRLQQQQQQQQQPNFGLPPPPRMIPDPSTLASPYHMMQPPLNNNNNANAQNNQLPELQLPGIARRNLPQNDGACDELTTEEIDKHIEDIIQSSQTHSEEDTITFSATSFSGEPIALDSLPEHVKQLIKDVKGKTKKSNAKILQLDGEDDGEEGRVM
ncbi:hypothetical protein RMATCC62417_14079 [Rhizopus microsporus]|nr:hypothetical protein RMATCC62417_14079 [Rhizopus microsporus]